MKLTGVKVKKSAKKLVLKVSLKNDRKAFKGKMYAAKTNRKGTLKVKK